MASLRENRNKDGQIISYLIRVHRGRDRDGKQLKPWTTTFDVSPSWSEKTARKKAEAFAATFEKECKEGVASDSRVKFGDYCAYVLETKASGSLKATTASRYASLYERINSELGYIKLKDLRADHLNAFYVSLSQKGMRKREPLAVASFDLNKYIKGKKIKKKNLAAAAGIHPTTLRSATNGDRVNVATAQAIADALGISFNQHFSVIENDAPLDTKTILSHHRFISTVLDMAVKEGLVPFNVAKRATPPVAKVKKINYFQPETVYKILEAADKEPLTHKVFVYLCVATGARRGELAGLRWEYIDFSTGVIRFDSGLLYTPEKGVYVDTTKTSNTRFIKIPGEVLDLLRQLRKEQDLQKAQLGKEWEESGFVFVRESGKPFHPQNWTKWMNSFGEKHGLPHINPHAFRHTAASVLISNHVDIVTTSKMLGHANPATTARYYSHLIDEAAAIASESMSNVLLKRKEIGTK